MSKISIYDVVPVPKLADKLIGTSVGGEPEDLTYNFTLGELLNLFIPNIPGNTLQGVLDFGNTATQDINLTGVITTTTLNVGNTANILDSNLTGETHITGGLYDSLNSIGTAGQVLKSTGTQVEWFTIPTVIPNLQQVLASGNTAVNNIILTGDLSANNAALLTSTISTSLTLLGTLRDGLSSVGTNNQVLSSNVTGVRWVNLPVYSAASPLLYNSGTGVFSIQQANASQGGFLSAADWITFDGKQTAISLTTTGNSGPSTLIGSTINVPNYTLAGLNGVPQTRNLTINGVTYNLSADRSWTIAAGVSSVTATSPLFSTGGATPNITIQQSSSSLDGYLSSVDWLTFNNKQDFLGGTGLVKSVAGTISYITDNSANWNTAYNDSIVSAAVTGTATKLLTLNQQDGGTITASWSDIDTGLTSVGVSMPTAFTVTNSPLTSNGTIAITGSGNGLQYIDGTGALQTFPSLTGFVPYTGATGSVNLGVYSLTATSLIKNGGTSGQFLKADGSVDSSAYIVLGSLSASAPLSYNNLTGAFSIIQSGTVTDGYLSSTDWNTFNSKQGALTLTTTGTSGASTLIGNTLNIPQYTDQFVGTVTSVAALTLGTIGTDLSSSVVNSTTTPVITLNVPTASAVNRGALSAADWATFNSKQPAGNYITSLTGEATALGPGAAAVTLDNAAVTGKVLTGLNVTGGTVLAADSILIGFGKVQNQINGLIGGSIFQGVWNANTNTPALVSSVGTNGHYYIVSVAGTTNLDGITDWQVGDWAIFAGTTWEKVDNTDSVSSVNGFTGAVSLTTDNIPEGVTNLYFTNTRARAALSFVAGSGAYNSSTGAITIPTNTSQLTNGANFITLASLSGTAPIQYNNTTGAISITQAGTASNGYLSSTDWNTFNNKQATISLTTTGTSGAATLVGATLNIPQYQAAGTYVTSVTATSPLFSSGGTTPNITIQQASGSQSGFLSSTDWTTFNSKQNALTNPVTGTGTTNFLPKFTGTSTIGDSALSDGGAIIVATNRSIQTTGSGNYLRAGNYLWAGGSGGDYGSVGYNQGYTTTTTTYNYVFSDYASIIRFDLGGFKFLTAPSGTAGNAITFTQAMTLNASGNLGLGVTPSAWNTAYKAFQFGTTGAIFGESGDAANYFTTNTFVDAVGFKYITSDWALGYFQENGVHSWRTTATSGTAGAAITFTQAMTLFSTGNLLVGSPSPISDNGARLQVSGGGVNIKSGNGDQLTLNNAGERFTQIVFSNNTVSKANIWWDNTNTELVLLANSSGTGHLRIASTGAATFSNVIQSYSSQPIYLFSTPTDSNYEVLAIDKSATDARIRVYKSGTGSYRDLIFETGGSNTLRLASTGAATFSSSVKVNGTPAATSGILSVVTSTSTLGATADLGLLITNDGTNGKMSQIGFGYSESRTAAVIGGIISNGGGSTTSDLFFATRSTTVGSDAPTERMRITSDAYLRMASGSGGIQFNGDTAAANALDDYEEGTWIPDVDAQTGTYTMVFGSRGTYTKIGRVVTVQYYFRVVDKGTGSGTCILSNLPFASLTTSTDDSYTGTGIRQGNDLNTLVINQNSSSLNITENTGDPIVQGQWNAGSITYFT